MVSFPPVGAVAAPPAARRPIAAAAATKAPAAPASPAIGQAAPGLGFLAGLRAFARHVVKPSGTWHNPAVPPAADPGGLKVVTYNVMVKTTNLDAVAQDLRGFGGDVVCLQETSEATARELARRLGMHVAWHEHPLHSYGGNAILSRHPIVAAEDVALANPWKERLGAFWDRLKGGSPKLAVLDSRHLLHATLKVGDRTVDVLNGHLTFLGEPTNGRQLDQVAALAAGLAAKGRTVVAAGDWNADMARAGARLGPALADAWQAPARTVRVNGETLTLAQAEVALRTAPAGSPQAAALRLAVAGATKLGGGGHRLDDVFVSRDARVVASHVDQTTRASDHQPMWTELTWK